MQSDPFLTAKHGENNDVGADIVPIQPVEPDLPQDFAAFWTLYPRHIARKDAQKAWQRIPYDEQMHALAALVSWRRVWLARGELEFIPYPATWLNGERWEDELPASNISSAHVPAVNGKRYERGEMPEAVKAALRKLAGKA